MSATDALCDRQAEAPRRADVQVQLLHVRDCPHLGDLRVLLDGAVETSGIIATIQELEGPYPSPTLLVNGEDVTGRPAVDGPSCRLDLPTEEEILGALSRAATPLSSR